MPAGERNLRRPFHAGGLGEILVGRGKGFEEGRSCVAGGRNIIRVNMSLLHLKRSSDVTTKYYFEWSMCHFGVVLLVTHGESASCFIQLQII